MRAARKDENQAQIVRDLRKIGLQVKILNDTPDLLVRKPATGELFAFEVDGVTKNRKRDDKQLEFLSSWRIPRIKTSVEILKYLGYG